MISIAMLTELISLWWISDNWSMIYWGLKIDSEANAEHVGMETRDIKSEIRLISTETEIYWVSFHYPHMDASLHTLTDYKVYNWYFHEVRRDHTVKLSVLLFSAFGLTDLLATLFFHVSVLQYTPMIAFTVRKALGERYSMKLPRLFRKLIRSIFFFECLSSFWWSNQEIVDDRHVHLNSIKMKVSFIRDFIRCFTGGLRNLP